MAGICEGRVVLVTGAGRGIGRAHALAFAKEGARVLVNDLGVTLDGRDATQDPAATVVEEIRALGGDAIASNADVTSWDQTGGMVEHALSTWGRLDVVVNNAGVVRDRMFVSCTESEWDAVMSVHLKGHFCVARHAAAWWRAQSKAGHTVQARIINTSSGAGLLGSVGQSAYSTAKAGIAALTVVQAAELARYGVTANAIAPAARTRMTETVFADMMKKPETGFDTMNPANISPLVVWLGSVSSGHVSGRMFELSGGQIALCDGWRPAASVDRGARWDVGDIEAAVAGLLSEAVPPIKPYGA